MLAKLRKELVGGMEQSSRCVLLGLLLTALLVTCQAQGTCFPAIFNFGDDDGDTGGIHASFPDTTPADSPPYGQTYFGTPTGRSSDGRLIIDFIAEAYGLRLLDPYLQSVTSDFSEGVNFATWGATTQTVQYVTPFPLHTQVQQFQLFQKEVLEILNTTAAVVAASSLADIVNAEESGIQPYKKLYKDISNSSASAVNQTTDPLLLRTLSVAERVPLATYFQEGLYMISIGTNDIKLGILASNTTDQIAVSFPAMVTVVTTAVQDLYNAGARNIIVAGVGTIGCSPSVLTVISHTNTSADLDAWGCLTAYNTIARTYNTLLDQGLLALIPQLPSANVAYLDLYQMQHNLLFNYTPNGFQQTIQACCGVPSTYNYNPAVMCGANATIANVLLASATCTDPSVYVDWDGSTFTEAANKYFASQIFSGAFFSPTLTLDSTNCTHAAS